MLSNTGTIGPRGSDARASADGPAQGAEVPRARDDPRLGLRGAGGRARDATHSTARTAARCAGLGPRRHDRGDAHRPALAGVLGLRRGPGLRGPDREVRLSTPRLARCERDGAASPPEVRAGRGGEAPDAAPVPGAARRGEPGRAVRAALHPPLPARARHGAAAPRGARTRNTRAELTKQRRSTNAPRIHGSPNPCGRACPERPCWLAVYGTASLRHKVRCVLPVPHQLIQCSRAKPTRLFD